ncbi:CaiB/BaiF CoA transferase family protein [Falsigemmobacter intermedius]|uniref:CaiB/BaiF CoA transferase family protein n=1 Tax=Falsigemmobacter intermedius TaxID=1553448 RepID=UPI003F07181F
MSTEPEKTKGGAAAPLTGLTVIELGHSVAAPFAAQILGDLGARVIKVENPAFGDDARRWGPPFWEGEAATFQALNRNKLSVTLDIKDAGDLEKLRALMAGADIIVQNMRPGLVKRYGIDAEAIHAINPVVIYCNLGAFGEIGPLATTTGYDPLVQAFTGIMSVTGEAGRPPVRVGPSIVDQGSGMWCVIGILSALLRRRETGEGCVVDTSLFETGMSWMTVPVANALAAGREPGKSGSETPMLAPYRAFMSKDRHVVIAAGNDNLFVRLSQVLGKPDWPQDPRFTTNADRVNNRVALNEAIEAITVTQEASYWVAALDKVGVPCAPVQSVSEVLAHPQTEALEIMQRTPDERLNLVGLPLRFNGSRPRIASRAPSLGSTDIDALLAPRAQASAAE